MTDSNATELYEQMQDWLTFARRRYEKSDTDGETVALNQLKQVLKKLMKVPSNDR